MDERLWRLLVRSFSGEASPAEREELRAWIEADPGRAREVDSLRALWDAAGTLPARGDVDRAWERVAARTLHTVPSATRPSLRPAWRAPLLRVAALVVLALGTGLLWRSREALGDTLLQRTVVTGKGERVQVTLGDGSRVLLGVDSRLRYPRWFLGARRSVHLEGVAYFEVARDPERPFSVYTADAVTRVLGTRFTVRDYPGAEPARVAVTEGKVAVRPAGAPERVAILTRGQAVELPAPGAPAVIDRASETQDLAWTQGTIVFRDASVPEVLAEIGRWYDVEIQVADSALAARHLTISFDDEPLDTLLQEIAAALGARIQRRGTVLVLTPAAEVRSAAPDHAALRESV